MVYGIELVLRLTDKQVIELFPEGDRPENLAEMLAEPDQRFEVYELLCDTEVARRVRAAYRPALEERFGSATPGRHDGYFVVDTPTGRREFRAWSIGTHGDEDEPDQVFGVSLLSRYTPVWLDWREDHGGSNGPIDLGQEAWQLIYDARMTLGKVVRAFETAPLTIVNQHY